MSIASLERAIVAELVKITNNRKIHLKDLAEWSTTEIKPKSENELTVFLPELQVWATYVKMQ